MVLTKAKVKNSALLKALLIPFKKNVLKADLDLFSLCTF